MKRCRRRCLRHDWVHCPQLFSSEQSGSTKDIEFSHSDRFQADGHGPDSDLIALDRQSAKSLRIDKLGILC